MKKITIKCDIKVTDVYDDSWCPDPTPERVRKTLVLTVKRCISDDGTVDIDKLDVSNEVI